jgi:hypothetical protein
MGAGSGKLSLPVITRNTEFILRSVCCERMRYYEQNRSASKESSASFSSVGIVHQRLVGVTPMVGGAHPTNT